jgi:hypothetical protein
MGDIDNWNERPQVQEFENKQLLTEKRAEIDTLEHKINLIKEKKQSIQYTLNAVKNNYQKAKNSFDNWIEARKTVGSPTEDKEVLSRANKLDEIYQTQLQWKQELSKINQEITSYRQEINAINQDISKENDRAYEEQSKAYRKYELQNFLYRLLFILPILLIGIFFMFKFRKHKYWPLFLGFILFSFYSFFFGLLPYLPSYGGYIRYAVGIVLSIIFGIYFINKIRAFIENKKKELKVSTEERAKNVQTDTAEKALDNHMCPSCGKDFILKKWDKSNDKKANRSYGIVTNFCRFCGLELFKKCKSCGVENYAHLPYCANCGDDVQEKKQKDNS